MQTTLAQGNDPPVRADTPGQRFALYGAVFILLAIPAGLVAGVAESVVLEGVGIASSLESAVFVGFGLALFGVPGVLAYGLLLEIARRFSRLNRTTIILALPSLAGGWFITLPPSVLLTGAGGVTTVVSLAVFGVITLFAYKRGVF